MNQLFDADFLVSQLRALEAWLFGEVLTAQSLVQLVVIAFCYVFAAWIGPKVGALGLELSRNRPTEPWIARVAVVVSDLALTTIWLLLVWLAGIAATITGGPHRILTIAASLLAAWVAIGILSTLIRDRTWSKTAAVIAWTIAALNIIGILDETITVLDRASLSFGTFRISALILLKGIVVLAVLLWAATLLSALLERRIHRAENLTPSVRVLFTKLVKVLLIVIAIVTGLESVGIDLSAFTFFTGALGVGIGFGLQKLVSNLFSGVMILMDKSIKPGDVIEVGDTYGWVNSLGSRYVSIATRDGVEYLIPNEDFITQRVANWSFSSDEVRLKVDVGITYDTDVRKAIALCVEAANEAGRALEKPGPICIVRAFGESAINLELRFWIRDPRNGVANIKSEVMLKIWDKFSTAGVKFATPLRELHLRTVDPLPVTLREPPVAGDRQND